MLEHLPRYVAAAERWLTESGTDRQRARDRALALVAAAERRLRDADTRVASLGDCIEAEPDEARADALLDRLARARVDRAKAERDVESAQAEADAVRAAAGGRRAPRCVALADRCPTAPSAEVAAFTDACATTLTAS